MNVPKRVCDRMVSGMKQMRPIIEQQRTRDVSEADTVTLIKDLLAEVFGYDKYADLTSEHAIRGTYCDLAIRIDDKLAKLVEVKAIGISLEDRHVKQAIDYAANQGVEWVVLTNGVVWRLYHVLFSKPIDKQLIGEIDLTTVDCRDEAQQELLFLFTKEGFKRGAQAEMRDRKDATSRYVLSALILNNESVLNVIRRELRRVVEVNVDEQDIANVLRDQVIKRDALEGPEAEEAVRRVNRRSERSIVKPRDAAEVIVEASSPSTQQPVQVSHS
jgi:predicted type IV restriction endonuclease